MNVLRSSLVEVSGAPPAEIPDDVQTAILQALETEKKGACPVRPADIEQNIKLAKREFQPICQDTGSILFYVDCPVGYDQIAFDDAARLAVKEATKKGFLRQNSVDSITGVNDGTNVKSGLSNRSFSSTSRSGSPCSAHAQRWRL